MIEHCIVCHKCGIINEKIFKDKESIEILKILHLINNVKARSKTQKPRKTQKFFSEICKSEFWILAIGQNRKLGKKKTRNNISEISEISEVS